MRILQVSQAVYPTRGGVELHVYNLATELARLGHEVVVAVSSGARESETYDGISVEQGISILGIERLIRTFRPDAIHAHGARSLFAALTILLGKQKGIQTVFTPHCFYPAQDAAGRLKRAVFDPLLGSPSLRSANAIVCLTQNDCKDAIALGARQGQISIIPNSIRVPAPVSDAQVIDFKNRNGLSEYLLSVGRIDRVKRGDFLINALAQTRGNLQLAFAGPDAGHRTFCEAEAKRLGISDRVRFLGAVSDTDLLAAYQGAGAYVMASAYEGLPTAMLEAMALGTPVVVASSGGIGHVIDDCINGYLYPYDDTSGFLLALERCVKDDNSELIRQAQLDVVQRYSWASNSQRVLQLYRPSTNGGNQYAVCSMG